MLTATLDDFMALNDELAALAAAGVPLDLGLSASRTDVASTLERINAVVARRVSQGVTLAEALQREEQVISPEYRALMLLGLESGDLQTALKGSNRLAETVQDSWHVLRLSVLYPLIVCGLAYAGVVTLCTFLVPTLENLYASMQLDSGWMLRILHGLRTTLPYWVAIPPLLLLGIAWLLRAHSRNSATSSRWTARLIAWAPDMSRALYYQRYANFAETLATLLERGAPLAPSLRIAADACGDTALGGGAKALATRSEQGELPSDDTLLSSRFPPFLRWALWSSEPVAPRPQALQMAAGFYRGLAQHSRERWRVLAPIVACVVLGGGVTLLYGLAFFLPIIELLRSLAS